MMQQVGMRTLWMQFDKEEKEEGPQGIGSAGCSETDGNPEQPRQSSRK
jgi:hypothetical protein